jgi:uncharacterized repeat protein (TIGR03803 family)
LLALQRTILAGAIFYVVALLTVPAQAQTYSILHSFTGGGDGHAPVASLTLNGGVLYGTTFLGGGVTGRNCNPRTAGCGVVFQMKRQAGGWILTPLFAFNDFDGAGPSAPLVFGPGGLLFGSTINGGNNLDCFGSFYGCGTIFTLHPTATACHSALCQWIENPIYQFPDQSEGFEPMGDLAFDHAGNLYGATKFGGNCFVDNGCGIVFQLTRSGSGWTKTTLHNFTDQPDGALPYSGVIMDRSGNLYGTTAAGGAGDWGTVYELTPSGGGWTETILYRFQNLDDGNQPLGGMVMDAAGNLYGTTSGGGSGGGGTVFELSPSGGGWTFSVLASFSGVNLDGPWGDLAFDSAGNLYGTTHAGGAFGLGSVFKLTPSGGQWTYTDLHDFTCSNDDGVPQAGVTLDSNGTIYGSATGCTSHENGVVWEITP